MKTLHDCLVPSSGDPAFLHVLLLIIVTEMVLGAGDCRCGKKASLLDSFSIPLEVDEMLHSGLWNERSCQNDCKKRRRTHGDGYSVRIRCKKNIPNVLRLYLFESFSRNHRT